ncbi:RIP metalloprotease RseP [Psychrobacter lutiphocae]|uniref:RIP metalloprotease RseP n=1 Tax=Psychrobacter lutiphocae TaxID=540500 RepID=UPI00037FDA9E|nr:RIP metalloprotease RseP [Psychrobacter lutiphocae]
MSFLLVALAFIAVLGPLVALHEWGHYIVARLCGVKVLTYSIGFGPKLYGWTSKKSGIDYRISALPLGGYVKMLDEREADVADSEKHLAFNNQHPLKKIAIVAAGPLMNFIIAIALFWVLFVVPSEQLNTRIGSVIPDSPAASVSLPVGDKIVAVDGHPVQTWEEVNYRLADRMGETGTVRISVQPMTQIVDTERHQDSDKQQGMSQGLEQFYGSTQQVEVPITNFLQGEQSGIDTLSGLGVLPWQPHIEPVIAHLSEDGAAIRQGMQVGDRITAIDGHPIDDWIDATHLIRDNPEKLLTFQVLRQNDAGEMQQVELKVMPQGKKGTAGQRYGQIGAGVDPGQIVVPDEYKTMVSYGALTAIGKSFAKTGQLANMTLKSMGKMVTGKVGLENLSGPISIAVVSKQSFDISWKQVLATAAIISLSLAVLNLLPIPVLDGGHLVYYIIELIRGKPLPEHMQAIGLNIGFLLLIGFMILAITNDFSRYF